MLFNDWTEVKAAGKMYFNPMKKKSAVLFSVPN